MGRSVSFFCDSYFLGCVTIAVYFLLSLNLSFPDISPLGSHDDAWGNARDVCAGAEWHAGTGFCPISFQKCNSYSHIFFPCHNQIPMVMGPNGPVPVPPMMPLPFSSIPPELLAKKSPQVVVGC